MENPSKHAPTSFQNQQQAVPNENGCLDRLRRHIAPRLAPGRSQHDGLVICFGPIWLKILLQGPLLGPQEHRKSNPCWSDNSIFVVLILLSSARFGPRFWMPTWFRKRAQEVPKGVPKRSRNLKQLRSVFYSNVAPAWLQLAPQKS